MATAIDKMNLIPCDGIKAGMDSPGVDTPTIYFDGGVIKTNVEFNVGAFSSASAGPGVRMFTGRTSLFRIYADDAGKTSYAGGSIPDQRVILGRNLITADQTGGDLRSFGVMGQLKSQNGTWNDEQFAGVYGLVEIVRSTGTVTFGGTGITAAVMGTISTSGAATVGTNHVLAGVAAVSKLLSTLTQTGKTAGFYVGIYDATNWSDGTARAAWGSGLLINPAAVNQGIVIDSGTLAGSSTAGGILQAGTLSSPVIMNTASCFGIKVFTQSTDTAAHTTARFRALGNAASGTPEIIGVLAQASAVASKYVGQVAAIRAEAIFKASATVGSTEDGAVAGYFKIEDDPATSGSGTSPTYSGRIGVLNVFGQISADPTGGYYGIVFDCQSAAGGTGVQAWDSMLHIVEYGGQNQNILALFSSGATLAQHGSTTTKIISSGTLTNSSAGDVLCDAKIRVNLGGTSYWIPLFDTAP